MGYAEAKKQMEEIKRLTSTFLGKKAQIEIGGNWDTVKNQIKTLRTELRALQAEKEKLRNTDTSAFDEDQLQEYDAKLKQVNADMVTIQNQINRLTTASQNAGKSLTQTFNSISSRVRHLGGALQTLGNTLTRVARPFNNLMRGTVFAAGYKLLGLASEGLAGATERADIMKTYAPIIKSIGAGLSENDAEATKQLAEAYNALDDSVQGLPTGLDEIIEQWKLLTIATQDYDKAAQLAIASNNAFIAGGADEARLTMAKKELQTYMTTGKLNERQLMTLQKGIPTAWNEIEQKMKDAGRIQGSLLEALKGGVVTANEFADALIDVGTNGKVAESVKIMKHTYQAATANIRTAFKRMGQNVLATLDEIFQKAKGKDTIDMLISLKDVINAFSKGVQSYLRDNADVLLRFMDALKEIDWKGLLTGFGDGLLNILKAVSQLAKFAGKFNLYRIGKFLGSAGFFGRFFTISGGLIRGTGHLWAALGTGIKAVADALRLLGAGRAAKGAGLLAKLFAKLAGKGGAAQTAAEGMTTVASSGKLLKSFKGVAMVAGEIAMISGAGFVAFKAVKSMIKDLGEIIDIAGQIDWQKGATVLAGMGAFFTAFGLLGAAAGANLGTSIGVAFGTAVVGTITTLISAFGALDTWLVKKAMENFKSIIETLGDTVTLMNNLPTNADGGVANIKKALRLMNDAYIALMPDGSGSGIMNISKGEAKAVGKRIKAFADMVSELPKAVNAIVALNDMPNVDRAKENIVSLLGVIEGIYETAKEYYDFGDKSQSNKIKAVFDNLTSTFTSIRDIYDLVRAKAWNADMGDAESGRMGGLRTILKNIFDFYEEAKTLFTEEGFLFDSINTSWSERLNTVTESLRSMFENIDAMYDLLRQREWNKDLTSRFDGIKAMFEGIKGLMDELKYSFTSDYAQDKSSELSASTTNLIGMFQNIDAIYDILRKREWTVDMSDRISAIIKMFTEVNKLRVPLLLLKSVDASNAATNIEGITKALTSLKALATEGQGLEGVSFASTIEALNELVPQVEAIGKAFTEGFIDSLDFDKITKALKSGLDKVLRATNGYASKFRASAKNIGNAFKGQLQAELSNVTVNTSVNVRIVSAIVTGVSTVANAIRDAVNRINSNTTYPAQGGVIYRAEGGSIFKPRGTDRVPAMLTVGEYVHNKHAVALFGKEFMDKVNSLDIEGAMNALHSRFGSQITTSRVSTVNNIVNNNNNQRVTQNVYTNNANFPRLRTNRYVGAL